MSMLDEEINRLGIRMKDLTQRVIPDFEARAQRLYARIIMLVKDSPEREKLEQEYAKLSKEIRQRSDEMMRTKQEIDRLEIQKKINR